MSVLSNIRSIFRTAPILSSLALIVLAVIVVVAYWLREFYHLEAIVKHPTIIENIRIDREGDFTWKVPNGTWNSRKGEGRISLMLKKMPEFRQMRGEELMDRVKRPLKLKIEVYSLGKDGTRRDRLIRDSYFNTDEPFSEAGARLWTSSSSASFEYGLAGIWTYPRENVFIHLQVTKADTMLARGDPRLKISADYDYAAVPWFGVFILICYGILFVLLSIFFVLSYFIWMKIDILGP